MLTRLGVLGCSLSIVKSRRNLQLLWIKQQKTSKASFFSAAVIADNDDQLLAIDYGGAYSFSVLQALQARNGDKTCRITLLTAPEPELEVNLFA